MAASKKRVDAILQINKSPLKRVLGLTDLFAIGYGDLGSSIFYALGITAMFALGATPLALSLAGFIFVCTALSYAEMTSIYQDAGGSASFARHAFNDLISFIAGWGLLLDYIVTIAISAFTIAPYLSSFFPILKTVDGMVFCSIAIIWILFVINFVGVKGSTRMSFILMLATLGTQAFFVVIGLIAAPDIWHVFRQLYIGLPNASWSPSWQDFIKGTVMAMVAYTGIESIAQLGSEAKQPKKTVPRSILLTMVVLLFIYFGLSTTALALLTPHELGFEYTQHPLEGVAAKFPFGQGFFVSWIGILAAVVLFIAANAGLIGASRLSFNMGEYYQLPQFFYRLHKKFRTPHMALMFFAIAATIIVALSAGVMTFLADLYNFGAQLAFLFTHISLIVIRIKHPNIRRSFKVPFNLRVKGYEIPITAIVGAISTLGVWLLVVIEKPGGRYLGISWLLIGIFMYWLYRRKKQISPTAQVLLEPVRIPRFGMLKIKKILLPVQGSMAPETIQTACAIAKAYNSELIILAIVEVPFTLPLESSIPHRIAASEAVLKIVQAIALDYGLAIQLKLVRARDRAAAILECAQSAKSDLIVLQAEGRAGHNTAQHLGITTEQVLRKAHSLVWICGASSSSTIFKR